MLTNKKEVYLALLFSYCQSMVTRKQAAVIWNVGGEIRRLPASIETPGALTDRAMINMISFDETTFFYNICAQIRVDGEKYASLALRLKKTLRQGLEGWKEIDVVHDST